MYGLKMITKDVAREIRSIFNAPDRAEADRRLKIVVEKYRKEMPRLADWMEEKIPEGLSVFSLPEHHRRRLRTKVATIFPKEESAVRLVAACLMENNDDRSTPGT